MFCIKIIYGVNVKGIIPINDSTIIKITKIYLFFFNVKNKYSIFPLVKLSFV